MKIGFELQNLLLKKAKELEEEFLNGRSNNAPKELADNEPALAYYNFSNDIFDNEELLKTQFHIETSLTIDSVIKQNIIVDQKQIIDWISNQDILGKINIELGDKLYELHQKFDLDTDWTKIDSLIEECLKIAKVKFS
jgi:type I restriction enzyme R subunit